ncbi:hypothetical protein ACVW00_001253 [Marmoricola sp. URHA0025 HA25]
MVGRPLLLAAALALPLLAGCSGSGGSEAKPSAAPTPIGKLDVAHVRLSRTPFCSRLPGAAVRATLGATATDHASWGNGDPVPGLAGGDGEVGHELGCAWTGPAGAGARAWVFARPVSPAFATTLVGVDAGQPGCTQAPAPTFGSPATLQSCTLPSDVRRIRRAGLFGDTWLTCEVSGAAAGLEKRTDQWCAAVVAALRLP